MVPVSQKISLKFKSKQKGESESNLFFNNYLNIKLCSQLKNVPDSAELGVAEKVNLI